MITPVRKTGRGFELFLVLYLIIMVWSVFDG
jgi:hypothetical protein